MCHRAAAAAAADIHGERDRERERERDRNFSWISALHIAPTRASHNRPLRFFYVTPVTQVVFVQLTGEVQVKVTSAKAKAGERPGGWIHMEQRQKLWTKRYKPTCANANTPCD